MRSDGVWNLRVRPPRRGRACRLWVPENVSPNVRGESSPGAEPQRHHQGVLRRLPVIVVPPAGGLEAEAGVEVLRRAVSGAHFEDGLPRPRPRAEVEREAQEFTAEAAPPRLLPDADVVDV